MNKNKNDKTIKCTTSKKDGELKQPFGYTSTKIAPYIDEFLITLSSLVGHTGQVRVSLLAVLSHHAAVIEWVFPQEAFRVVVAVNVDLGQSIMGGRLLTAFMDARLQPGQQQLQSVGDKEGLHLFIQLLRQG